MCLPNHQHREILQDFSLGMGYYFYSFTEKKVGLNIISEQTAGKKKRKEK